MPSPDRFHSDLTANDRLIWKTALNWPDGCDERAKFHTEKFDGEYGLISTYPIGGNQFIVDVECSKGMRHSEHFYYKVTATEETIESQLLTLEQCVYCPAENEDSMDLEAPKKDPKGEFVRFTDSLAYGVTLIPEEIAPKVILFDPHSSVLSCGLYTVYDVSGAFPKISEFRAMPSGGRLADRKMGALHGPGARQAAGGAQFPTRGLEIFTSAQVRNPLRLVL